MVWPTSSVITTIVVLVSVLSQFSVGSSAPNNRTSKHDYLLNYILKPIENIPEETNDIAAPVERDPIKYDPNFIDLYHGGIEAYLSSDWEACVERFERSNVLYLQYVEAVANCRVQCEFERVRFKNTQRQDYDSIQFYEKLIVKTLCLERCRQKNLGYLPRHFVFENEFRVIFKMRKSYEYLQLCYYKEDEIEKAISATYTVLVANPGDEVMRRNIKYYAELKEFDLDKIKDLEDKRFASYYQDGVNKYEVQKWAESIELLEIALDIWLQEHDKCRAFCDSGYDHGWYPDFTSATSNHYVSTLRCKQNCTREISFVNGRFYEDLYPSMYNYLQFAYYHIDRIEEASRCAASYMLFYPKSEEMIENVKFYSNRRRNSIKYLEPRDEAKAFNNRAIYEANLLAFVDEEFSKLSKEPFRIQMEGGDVFDSQSSNARNENVTTNIEENEVK